MKGPDGQQTEYEPVIHPYDKGGRQDPVLH